MGLFGLNEKTVAKMEAKRDIKGLINALNDKHRGVPTRAAKALGQIKDARAVESLIKALEDENMHFRR